MDETCGIFDSDMLQSFPMDSCTRDEVVSSNSQLISAFPGKVGNNCELADPVALGSGVVINDDGQTFVARAPKCLKCFQILEETGTNISYRCPDCRNCMGCKKGPLVEETSIRIEQCQKLILLLFMYYRSQAVFCLYEGSNILFIHIYHLSNGRPVRF